MSGRGRGRGRDAGGGRGRGGRTNEGGRGQQLLSGIVTKKPKYHRYQNAEVLLTGDIYPNGAPPKPHYVLGGIDEVANLGSQFSPLGQSSSVDHCKQLPGLNNAMGKLAPHSTSEANCESLFSESGHLAKPHMNRVSNETFERLVIAKHRMSRIYCSPAKVKEEFLRRWKGKLFGKDEDRDG
ncbi:hypothetical protein THAOC_19381 [Thalassiosira oceanica]|uniref:Uncharacterized protein n=1 Tax=Thalassiosira oceanica TaxID=159749 RepID=K0S4X0_THAOC|nr:hypothetical protein THAOC_19381 [Thalassiosira oceanica]|eukprot:EJK60290.1 hypothetical protein THAOC_19381 [Thalassiosira oceanica]